MGLKIDNYFSHLIFDAEINILGVTAVLLSSGGIASIYIFCNIA